MTAQSRFSTAVLLAVTSAATVAAEGDLDATFNGSGLQTIGFDDQAFATATVRSADGRLYVLGGVAADESGRIAVARLLRDGAPDPSFNADGDADGRIVYDFYPGEALAAAGAVQTDGKLVLAGLADIDASPGFDYRMVACRILPDGAADEGFGDIATPGCRTIDPGLPDTGLSAATSILLQTDDKIVLAGFVTANGTSKPVVARLLSDGSMDAAEFGAAGIAILAPDEPSSITLAALDTDASGNLIAAGTLQAGPEDSDFAVFRVTPAGTQDMSFNEGLLTIAFDVGPPNAHRDEARAVAVLEDGSILVAGSAEHGLGQRQFAVAKVDGDGVLDPGFNGTGKASPVLCDVCVDAKAAALVVQSNGAIVLAGPAVANESTDFAVLRLTAAGEIDTSFGAQGRSFIGFDLNPEEPDDVATSAVSQDGRIVVAGTIDTPDGSAFGVARLQSDLIFFDDFEVTPSQP